MHEAEVQPLHTLIRRVQRVVLLLLLGHAVPSPITDLVAPNVKSLYEIEKHNVEAADTKQNLVAAAIKGLVVFAVDVDSDCTSLTRA